MGDLDHLSESEDEFLEDFSGWEISDKELEEILLNTRAENDIRLRRLVKHIQYLRFLNAEMVERAEQAGATNTFVSLSKAAISSRVTKQQS